MNYKLKYRLEFLMKYKSVSRVIYNKLERGFYRHIKHLKVCEKHGEHLGLKRLGLGDLGAGRMMRKRKNRRPSGLPTTRPKLPWNCPGCEMPNYCVLKQNYLQLKSEFNRYR